MGNTQKDIAKALAILSGSDVELTEAQAEAFGAFKSQMLQASAVEYLDGKLSDGSDSTAWAEELFDLAERFGEQVNGENKNRGRGEVFEQVVILDTPAGELKIVLSNAKR